MSAQMTLDLIPSVTFSQALASGRTHSEEPAGRIAGQYGQEAVRANLSARQATEKGLMMSGICGRPGITSSESLALQSYLVNKLRVKAGSLGSTLYTLTWKQRATPSRRLICALRASVPRTSGSGFSLQLCGYPTPLAADGKQSLGQKMSTRDFTRTAGMAGWPTTAARDYKGSNKKSYAERGGGKKGEQLPNAVAHLLKGWSTALASDASKGGRVTPRKNAMALPETVQILKIQEPVRLTASGQVLTGSAAKMDVSGQLNPAHSRWLMGLPQEWDVCGVMAMQSMRK